MERETAIQDLRPKIDIVINGQKNEDEYFMHQALRPILKLQHHIICKLIATERHLKVNEISKREAMERHNYMGTFLQKNATLRNTLIGVIVGCLTNDELATYLEDRKATNKRIVEMIIVRFLSTLEN